MSDLLLRNCRVLTMDPARPLAEAVLVRGDRIAWVGADADVPPTVGGRTRILDCGGGALLPGFHDAHCHLLSYAASLGAVDCRPSAVSSIDDIKRALTERAAVTTPGQWVRGTGYDDFHIREKRHPTRWELDAAAPSHPVRLDHRSGHACVLNSLALEIARISGSTDEPHGATIARRTGSGEPSGLLLEFAGHLEGLIPQPGDVDLQSAVLQASQLLASKGITSLQDATAANDLSRWNTFRSLKSSGSLLQRAVFMAGAGRIGDFLSEGLRFLPLGDAVALGGDDVRLGAAKIVVTRSSGKLHPGRDELREIVEDVSRRGFPVAIHAVEAEAVSSAAEAIASASSREPPPGSPPSSPGGSKRLRHRIEHCSELPPEVLSQVAASGAMVVTQPGFIYANGAMYLAQVDADMQRYLYRVGSLARSGVRLAFGSDAPVADPNPLLGIYSAVTRRSAEGPRVAAEEGIGLRDALSYATLGAAVAGDMEAEVGVVRPGMLADLVLLKQDPPRLWRTDPEELLANEVALTVMAGSVVWEG